jgi:hypothetical protein
MLFFMGKFLYQLVFLLLLAPCITFGQYHKLVKYRNSNIGVEVKGKEFKLAKAYCTCFNKPKYSTNQRLDFFPFNKAATVKLISFAIPLDTPIYTALAPSRYVLNQKSVIESKLLSISAVDSLTDILYNVGYSPIKLNFKLVSTGYGCYSPRNAILFLDSNGEINEYIELCFDCEKYYLSSAKIKNTEYCEQKYDMLKAFFLSQGIKYGTTEPKGR